MMGVTHVWVGTMAAVLLTEPASPQGCLAALIGGSLGGIVPDIDLGSGNRLTDISRSRRITGAITLVCLLVDSYFGGKLMMSFRSNSREELAAGLFGLMLLCLWGWNQSHRGGTHSLLALVLFGGCVELLCSPLTKPFVIAMASHILLDVLNCSSVQLFYPLRGRWSFRLCKAGGRVDHYLRLIGIIGTVLGIGISLDTFR